MASTQPAPPASHGGPTSSPWSPQPPTPPNPALTRLRSLPTTAYLAGVAYESLAAAVVFAPPILAVAVVKGFLFPAGAAASTSRNPHTYGGLVARSLRSGVVNTTRMTLWVGLSCWTAAAVREVAGLGVRHHDDPSQLQLAAGTLVNAVTGAVCANGLLRFGSVTPGQRGVGTLAGMVGGVALPFILGPAAPAIRARFNAMAKAVGVQLPDGSQLVVAFGRLLMVYDATSGELVRFKEAHDGAIYTLSCSKDGAFVASGAADKVVSVWTYELARKYTFTHNDTIQALAFNPAAANVLASCSATDFAIWTMPSPSIKKVKVTSRILCAAWSSDGLWLAMGMHSGAISIRDGMGVEKMVISRTAPVWDIAFAPTKTSGLLPAGGGAANGGGDSGGGDTLAVGCWDGTLSFYNAATGERVGEERRLGFDPTSVRYFTTGEYLVVGGSDHKATLYTRDGVKLNPVTEGKDWIWRAAPRPKSNFVAVAGNDGVITMHTIVFSTVHGLYQDRYAFRDAMTDVVVQHLVSDQRVRIKCRDYVKKIAVYRERLAVQLPDKVIVYEVGPTPTAALAQGHAAPVAGGAGMGDGVWSGSEFAMGYRVKSRINQALECNLLVVTSQHVILCLEKKLQLYTFAGWKEREWVLDAVIRYIKVVGGPPGKEGLLVGLKNGQVLKIFVDNPFPQVLVRHGSAVRCLDLSMSRRRVAVVDETSTCTVYDVVTGERQFSESGANSVAWNTVAEHMLCFSGNGNLSIKTGTFPLHTQKLQGFVVGFAGSKIFCLHSVAMQTIDVPQSASLYRYVESREWEAAYKVACLGVTDADWRLLGQAALRALQLHIARSCYVRLVDTVYLELIAHLEGMRKAKLAAHPGVGASGILPAEEEAALAATMQAEVAAYAGRYAEAGRLYLKGGSVDRAIDMFSDLRLWDEARKFAEESGRGDVASLMLRQAAWCEENGDAKAASTIYAAVGQCLRAVRIVGERGLHSHLVDLIRSFPSAAPGGTADAGGRVDSRDASGGDAGMEGDSATPRGGMTRDVREALVAAGDYFTKADLMRHAKECYVKLGDVRRLLQAHVDACQWDEALHLASQLVADATKAGDAGALRRAHDLMKATRVSHAAWLAGEDRLVEAQESYESAGRPDLAAAILHQLATAAVEERRYNDACRHFLRLASDCAQACRLDVTSGDVTGAALHRAQATAFRRLGSIYAAYHVVHGFVRDPFTVASMDTVYHAARYVLNSAYGTVVGPVDVVSAPAASLAASKKGKDDGVSGARPCVHPPSGVSAAVTLYALARSAVPGQCFKTARYALDRLQSMLVPAGWRDVLDLAAMHVATKTYGDASDSIPLCFRCGAANPTLNLTPASLLVPPAHTPPALVVAPRPDKADPAALAAPPTDVCTQCGHEFIRSFATWQVLPLVQFTPADGTAEDALRALARGDGVGSGAAMAPGAGVAGRGGTTHASGSGDQQVMSFSSGGASGASGAKSGDTMFNDLLNEAASLGTGGVSGGGPVVAVPLAIIARLNPADVFVARPAAPSDASPYALKAGGGGGAHEDVSRGVEAEVKVTKEEETALLPRFFKNVLPEVALAMCKMCHHFFALEDLEFEVLKHGCCPVCRAPAAAVWGGPGQLEA